MPILPSEALLLREKKNNSSDKMLPPVRIEPETSDPKSKGPFTLSNSDSASDAKK